MTWDELVASEPLLGELLKEAEAHRDIGQSFCANTTWYGDTTKRSMRARMARLVGYARRDHPLLGTSRAYDVAYRKLYESLPDCSQDCACQTVLKAALGLLVERAEEIMRDGRCGVDECPK